MKRSNHIISFIGLILFTSISTSPVFAKKEAISVGTTPLNDLLVSAKFSAPANIISLNHAIVSAEITGRALKVKAEVGDNVKKGQNLVSLDCRSYSLAKKQATAALKVAKTQYNYSRKQLVRNQKLIKKGIIPREVFEKAEAGQLSALADIELQKVSIETADLAISRCYIKAPFSGQISKRLVQKGQLVTAGTPLFKILQNDQLEVQAKLSPRDIQKIQDATIIEFVAGETKLATTVRSIIKTIDETTRTQEVRLSFLQNPHLATGLSGRIEWSNREKQLPAEYILRRGDKLGVMIAEDIIEGIGKAKFYPIPHAKEGQAATINLSQDKKIITLNRYRVKEGATIKLIKEP